MTEEARMCVESCREWYQAFSNFGKGEERSVKELLAVADLIESLSAQLDQVTRERDSAVEDLSGYCGVCIYKTLPNAYEFCRNCKHSNRHYFTNEPALNNWQWRGVEEE